MRKLTLILTALAMCFALALCGCATGPSKETCEKVCGTWLCEGGEPGKAAATFEIKDDGSFDLVSYAKWDKDKLEKYVMNGTWTEKDGEITYEIAAVEVEGDLGGKMKTDDRSGTISVDGDEMKITGNGDSESAKKVSAEELDEFLNPKVEELTAENADELLSQCDIVVNEVRKVESDSGYKSLYPDQFQFSITNNSDKTVRDLNIEVVAWNADKKPIRIALKHRSEDDYVVCLLDDAYIEPGQTYDRDDWGWDIAENSTYDIAYMKAIVINATFEDGTTWENPYEEGFDNLYVGKPLA